jgi:demethylmenaquinone methyltransferase/2-methoxy-6-polyprenyl-1,4-benzoquinol methylase/phosphoethanolamine N-methyltransferase
MMQHFHSHENPVQTEGRLIRWASSYDFLTNILTLGQAKRLRTMTVDGALLKPGERMLDVGCGTGGVTIPAKQRVGAAGSAAGIDPSPEMIAVARGKAQRKGLEIDFRIGVIEALPFPDATFDVVTSSLMMHHLPEHLQVKGLAEIYRVLKPGGRLLIADMVSPKASGGNHMMNALAMHSHVKFGIEDLRATLKGAGFEEITQLEQRFFVIGFMRAKK